MERKIFKGICSVIFFIHILEFVGFCKEKAPTEYYTYDGRDIGARPIGIGGAFVAVADTADAPYWNPAGLYQLKGNSASFMLDFSYQSTALWDDVIKNEPLRGKKFCYICFASPQGALSWESLSDYTKSDFFEQVVEDERYEIWQDIEVKVNKYMFSSGRHYSKQLIGGVNISYLSGRLAVSTKKVIDSMREEVESNLADGNGFSIDWGFIYILNKYFHLGLMIQNLPAFMYWDDYKQEKLPSVVRTGFAMKMTDLLTFSCDYEERFYEKIDKKNIYHVGIEQIILDTIFLRGGMYGADLNRTKEVTYTVGIGYKKENYIVDLAMKKYFLSPTFDESVNNYLCSLSMPF